MINNRMSMRDRLKDNLVMIGPFCKMSEPTIYELAGLAGFDFVIIDMEHGPISYETAQNLIRICELVGMSPIIRVPKNEEHYILRALDVGAQGIQVPQVNTKKQAWDLVEASRYYPRGKRGICRFVRAARYSSMPASDYLNYANEHVIVVAQLEGAEGIENLEDILEVDGLDIIFIGPYDLSQSLGVPGQVHHPVLMERMNFIVTKARAKGKVVGTFAESLDDARVWISRGIRYIAYSVDVGLILSEFMSIVKGIRELDPMMEQSCSNSETS